MFPRYNDVYGDPIYRCPRRLIFTDPDYYNDLVQSYNHYKAGFLPHAGSLMDQAAKYPDLISIVDYTVNECDRIEMERERNKGKSDHNLLANPVRT